MVNVGTLQSGADHVVPNDMTVSGNAVGVTATFDLAGFNDTVAVLRFGGSTTTSGATVTTGAGTLTLGGGVEYIATNHPLGATLSGNLALGSATRTFTVNDSATAADDLTVAAAITGGAGVGLTKSGPGRLVLSGTNSYAGNTLVNGGLLQFNTLNSIAGSGLNLSVTAPGAVALGYVPGTTLQNELLSRIVSSSTGAAVLTANTSENLDFSNGGPANNFTALSLGAIGNLTYSGTLTPNDTTYRLGGGGGTLTLGNPINGTGKTLLIHGNVSLSTVSDFTGTTTINSGTLQVKQGATTNVVNSGTILFDHSDSQNQTGTISGSGTLTKSGSGTLTLAVPQTYSGTTTVSGGTLVLAGGNHTLAVNKALVVNTGGTLDLGSNSQYGGQFSGTGGLITGSGGRLTVQPTGTATYAGSIQGSVNFVKLANGAGKLLTLTGDSTTTGGIWLLGGDLPETQGPDYGGLTLKDGGRLSGASAITLNHGSLFIDNSGTANDNTRVNDAATVTLNGGRIIYTGRAATASAELLGEVTVGSGMGTITATAGASGSAVLTLNRLVRNPGATLQLDGSNLGTAGNNSRILVTAALGDNLTAVNGVIPGVFKGSGGGAILR